MRKLPQKRARQKAPRLRAQGCRARPPSRSAAARRREMRRPASKGSCAFSAEYTDRDTWRRWRRPAAPRGAFVVNRSWIRPVTARPTPNQSASLGVSTPLGSGPRSRTPHLRVAIAFEILIERRGAGRDERRAEDGLRHAQPVKRSHCSQRVTSRGGHDHEKRDVRLGERQKCHRTRRSGNRSYARRAHRETLTAHPGADAEIALRAS